MAVSMISMNSISYSNYDSGSGGGGSSLLDFGTGNSGGDSSATAGDASAMPMMDQSAMAPMDTSSVGPQMDASQMTMDPSAMGMAPTDSFQSGAPADYSPPPQAAAGPGGGFDFVA
jgi:hypothetical protein